MKCERCGADTTVEKLTVDGYTGYVCEDCRAAWLRLAGTGPSS